MGEIIVGVKSINNEIKVQSKWEKATVPEMSNVIVHLEILKLKLIEEIKKMGKLKGF